MYPDYTETWATRNRKEKRAVRKEKIAIVVLTLVLCFAVVLS